jgi:predicted nucleic acid-binding protein
MRKIGFDTGFFFRLNTRHSTAVRVWESIAAEKYEGVVSCLSLFELRKLSYQNRMKPDIERELQKIIPKICTIAWLEESAINVLHQGAKHAHTFGLPAIDSLIMTSLIAKEVKEVYTTDPDMERFKGKDVKIIRLD